MRLIFCSLILFASLSVPAHAIDNGSLYKDCKKLADRSFQVAALTDIVCVTYFRGVLDNALSLCDSWGSTAELQQPGERRDTIEMFRKSEGVASEVNIEAAVQIYVNKLEKKPEKWTYRADYEVLTSLQQLAPCK